MDEKINYRSLLLKLWDTHASLYRERFGKFNELQAADSRGEELKKRFVTQKMRDLHCMLSGADLFLKETREGALDYLDSLSFEELKNTKQRLEDMMKNPDYRSFSDLVADKHYRLKHPRKRR